MYQYQKLGTASSWRGLKAPLRVEVSYSGSPWSTTYINVMKALFSEDALLLGIAVENQGPARGSRSLTRVTK